MQCHSVYNLEKFKDTESDGDVWGTCPHCKKHTMIIEVFEIDEDDIPF